MMDEIQIGVWCEPKPGSSASLYTAGWVFIRYDRQQLREVLPWLYAWCDEGGEGGDGFCEGAGI